MPVFVYEEMAFANPTASNSLEAPDRQVLGSLFHQPVTAFDGNIDGSTEDACCSLNNANILKEERCCWEWDKTSMSNSVILDHDKKEALFHPDYSCGTAAIRGTDPFELGCQHYWEVQMTSAIYGTDMMIGIGSSSVNLNSAQTAFTSLLGKDSESWGLSYLGTIQHEGEMKQFTTKLERDTIIGIHLDMWHGTLSIYRNGKPCGIAFSGLQNKELYPMLSSTAARTRMKLKKSCCLATSLQYLCCQTIGKHIEGLGSVDGLPLPPGTKKFMKDHMGWVVETASSHNAVTQANE